MQKKTYPVVLESSGTPDGRQIDGRRGSDPLTSKVAYIGTYAIGCRHQLQLRLRQHRQLRNTSAGVGPFALLNDLINR